MKDSLLLGQKPLVDSYLIQGPRPLSCFSFVSLFAWCDFFDFEFKIFDGSLCVFASGPGGSFMYLPPLGRDFSPSVIKPAFEHMAKGQKAKAVNRIENIPENLLSAFGQDGYNHYAKPKEYVYRRQDLVALKGNAYKSQRHDCNRFSSLHALNSFEPYTDDDFGPSMSLYEQWAGHRAGAHRDDIYRAMLQENRQVHARLLKYWRPLGLVARVLRAEKKIIGYTFGFALNEDTFCVYAEIADLNFQGAAAHMFRAFCADGQLSAFNWINTMDDFAMPQVARTKQAWRPSRLIASYTVSLKTGKSHGH